MINDNTARLFFPEGEVRELASPQGLMWEREIRELVGRLGQAYVTRNNGIKGLKAYGATPVKHKAEKLWGRYVPCEYIEGDGSAYIDTGVKITSNDEVYLNGCVTDSGSTFLMSQGLSANNQAYQLANTAGNVLVFDIQNYNPYRVDTGVSALNTIRKIHIKNREIFVDGVSKGTSTGTLTNPTDTAKLMYSASGSSAQKAKIVKFTVVGKCDLVAVKDVVDNVYGLWDRVGNKFYGNAGTGAFSGGSLIQPITYTQSDGTAYCDTGVIPTIAKGTNILLKLSANAVEANGFGANRNLNIETLSTTNAYWRLNGFVTDIPRVSNEIIDVELKQTSSGRYYKLKTAEGYGSNNEDTFSFYLGKLNGSTSTNNFKGRYYSAIIKENGALVRDYLPVRIGTTVELLDLVNWTFATRTGTFTAGADISYTQLCPDVIKVNSGDIRWGVGKNLFDKNNRIRVTGYFASTGTAWSYASSAYSNKIPCKPNTTYTARYNGNSTQAVLGFGSCSTDEEPSESKLTITVTRGVRQNSPTLNTPITITTGPNDKWLIVAYNIADPQHTDMADNLQIEEGSTATPYEPYAKAIRTDGEHKVIVGSQGVVDMGTLDWVLGGTIATGEYGFYVDLSDKHAGTTNIYCNGYRVHPSNWQNAENMDIWGNASSNRVYFKNLNYTTAAAFKAAMSGKLLFYQRNTDTSFVAPQIRDIPILLSAESNLDLQSGVKTEKWKIKVLDGTESWGVYAGTSGNQMNLALPDCKAGTTKSDSLVTHFDYSEGSITNLPNGYYKLAPTATNIMFRLDGQMADVASWKAYLASEYAKGTPVIIIYPLANPATEQVTIAPVTSQRRTTYIADSDSELGKTSLELDYLGK